MPRFFNAHMSRSEHTATFDPNLKDVSRGKDIVVTAAVFTALILLTTGTRIMTKLLSRVRLGIHDYFILLALALNLTGNSIEFANVQTGFGRHFQFLTHEEQTDFRLYAQLGLVIASPALWAVKMSICFFILSLITLTHRKTKWMTYCLIVLTTLSSLGGIIFWSVQAQPLEKMWKPWVPGKIQSKEFLNTSIITFTSFYGVTDLFYALAPITFIWNLQLSLKRKLLVIALTGSGLLCFFVSMFRAHYLKDFDYFDPDPSWTLRPIYICTCIERNLAEIIADLPAIVHSIRQLRKKVTPKHATYSDSSRSPFSSYIKRTRNSDKRRNFAAFGESVQWSNIDAENDSTKNASGELAPYCREDDIPLRHQPQKPGLSVHRLPSLRAR